MSKKYKIGYTQGVFDMFHIGHLNIINRAKEQCEQLIVGVNSDQLVEKYKHKIPVISEKNRAEIVGNLKNVDKCVIVNSLDKVKAWEKYGFDAVFIGDDWKGNKRWKETEQAFEKNGSGVTIVYLPYTPNVSSTNLRNEKDNSVEEI
jgi:glycerol-3-phosphate cytidylyltransferase